MSRARQLLVMAGWLLFGAGALSQQPLLPRTLAPDQVRSGLTFSGPDVQSLQADAFAGLRTRLPKLNLPMTLQLNVTNVTNSYLVGIGRYNTAYDGLLRVYLNQPRAYRFTTTFEF